MEYKTIYFSLIGIFGLVVWILSFWNIFKEAELQVPGVVDGRSHYSKARRWFVFILGLVGWLLISFALAGPRTPKLFKPASIEVNDIFFVVDVSRSMLAEDFKPNRLEVAKSKIKEFVQLRPTDRIGIIIFSEKAYTLLPLTTDLKLVSDIVNEIEVGFLGSGTAIGDALGLAVARGVRSEADNKVIILITDGVNNVGTLDPLKAADLAKENGIKVYTVGVGGDEGGHLAGYRMIPGGSIDFQTLKAISDKTGGRSYAAKSESSLKKVLLDIEKLEKSKVETQALVVYDELFYIYLFLGTIFFGFSELFRKLILREVL